MAEIEAVLAQIKQSLDELSLDVSHGKYPAPILKDFKLSVDQLRLTIWAIIEFEEQSKSKSQGAQFGLNVRLSEFRIKRLVQMLADLQTDIKNGRIPPTHPDLKNLVSTFKNTFQHLVNSPSF